MLCGICAAFLLFGQSSHELYVLAPASMREVVADLGKEFETRHVGVKVQATFAGTQILVFQLSHGARGDVLITADRTSMETAVSLGGVAKDAAREVAKNRLALAASEKSKTVQAFKDLSLPGVRLVLADLKVPAGRYAREAFTRAAEDYGGSWLSLVMQNVVSNELDVRAALAKVRFGVGDVAVVYATDVSDRKGIRVVEVPAKYNPTATYMIAPTLRTTESALGSDFIQFCRSKPGRSILAKRGFGLP